MFVYGNCFPRTSGVDAKQRARAEQEHERSALHLHPSFSTGDVGQLSVGRAWCGAELEDELAIAGEAHGSAVAHAKVVRHELPPVLLAPAAAAWHLRSLFVLLCRLRVGRGRSLGPASLGRLALASMVAIGRRGRVRSCSLGVPRLQRSTRACRGLGGPLVDLARSCLVADDYRGRRVSLGGGEGTQVGYVEEAEAHRRQLRDAP